MPPTASEASELMHRPLADLSYAAIDFESAGVHSGENDLPVQVGIVSCDTLSAETSHYCSYISCERPIHWAASQVHGITTAQLADAPSYMSLWPDFAQRLSGRVIVAHNYGTEYRFLQTFPGHGLGPWLDTLTLARRALPDLDNHQLGHICDILGITPELSALIPHKSWHDALYDAAASLLLLRTLIRELQMERHCLKDIAFAVKQS